MARRARPCPGGAGGRPSASQLRPIKINCVAVRGFSETEIQALAELARRKPHVLRFVEFMPLDADERWAAHQVLTGTEIGAIVERRWPLDALTCQGIVHRPRFPLRRRRRRAGVRQSRLGAVLLELRPHPLTADGRLRTCLFSRRDWDLRYAMRDGADDDALAALIREAVEHKELKHRINDARFTRASRSMSQIGG